MSGSGASNLGYSNIVPLSNVNGQYVNVGSTNNPANFGSNEIPGLPGLAGAKTNIDAAAGKVPGICLFKGGTKGLKRKIKNISKQYKKMKAGSKKMKSLKLKLRSRLASRMAGRQPRPTTMTMTTTTIDQNNGTHVTHVTFVDTSTSIPHDALHALHST